MENAPFITIARLSTGKFYVNLMEWNKYQEAYTVTRTCDSGGFKSKIIAWQYAVEWAKQQQLEFRP